MTVYLCKFIIIILSLKLTGASGRAVRCTTPVLACLLATELPHVLNNLRDAATCAIRLNMTNQLNTDQRRYRTAELQINEKSARELILKVTINM
jgi:hypothetical protein